MKEALTETEQMTLKLAIEQYKKSDVESLLEYRESLIDSLRAYFIEENEDDFEWLVHEINEVIVILQKLEA